MKKLRFKSLTMRIWTTFTVIILVIICSISLIYLVAFKRISENAKIQDLKASHDILIKSSNYDQQPRFNQLKNLKGSDNFIYSIDSNDGPQIIIGNKPKPEALFDRDVQMWIASFVSKGTVTDKQFKKTYDGKKYFFIISSIEGNGLGNTYFVSYVPNTQDNSVLYTVLIIGVVFIAIGFLTAKVVANYISKPLKELEDFTIRIAHKDWKEPIDVKNSDEIGRLAESMNRMQNELKHADEEEKMFLQSISHDLKTPVMVIMSHADAIIDGVYIESVEKTAEIIRDETICLERKIKQMLYLNTLNYVLDNNINNTKINLRDTLTHIINRFEVVNSKIQWDLDIDEISINGNGDKIQVSIENILDNGLRYAEERISISLKKKDTFAELEIYNDGPKIGAEHIDHIFDNFYKDKTGNFGLGLAISKKIINYYEGEIKAVNRDKGVSFIIKLPI